MNKLDLIDIAVPTSLHQTVDNAVARARAEGSCVHKPRKAVSWRYRIVAAAVVVAIGALLFNFTAIAAAVGQMFTAFQNSALQNPSREALVANDFPQSTAGALGTVSESNGYTLTLDSYYIDDTEMGFEFTLTGEEFPEVFSKAAWTPGTNLIAFDGLKLEIADPSSTSLVWEEINDRAAQIDTRTFPGGHYYLDSAAGNYAYEPGDGQDFVSNFAVTKVDETTYKIAGVISFAKPVEPGAHMDLYLRDLVAWPAVIERDDAPAETFVLSGEWNFSVDVDESFVNAQTLRYEVLDPDALAAQGITITSIAASPSGCRVDAVIDYTKNILTGPEVGDRASEPQYAPKLHLMATNVEMAAGNKVYGSSEAGYTAGSRPEGTECYFVFDSMYFDAPDKLTLRLFTQDGTPIEAALVQTPE